MFLMFVSLRVSLLTLLAMILIWVGMLLLCQAWQPLDKQLTWQEWQLPITVNLKSSDGLSFTAARLSVTRKAAMFINLIVPLQFLSCLMCRT